ncbi:putative E3 ubiquitin-protein ligase SINA-like 6 [Bidens hawaiensis]|uniref:putative E3 ubiquitin-protein ligase SINA-like 6 n=1 Tax=Bidens hawaiensis TaxID=980011 RepID=UPI00404A685D
MSDLSRAGPSNFPSLPSSSELIPDTASQLDVVEEEHMTSSGVTNQTAFVSNPDVLDCPICHRPLSSPVFQCANGHIACSSCCSKMNHKYPCSMLIGYNRCIAFEKFMDSVKVLCKNGCKNTIPYGKQNEHDQMCSHATCFCPHPSCQFADSSENLYLHFSIQHSASTTRFTYHENFCVLVKPHEKHIFLQEQDENTVFILNHQLKEHGRVLSVDCVGPNTLTDCFEYRLSAQMLWSSLCLESVPEVYTKWFEHPLKKFYLTIPFDFYTYKEYLCIHLCIQKVLFFM